MLDYIPNDTIFYIVNAIIYIITLVFFYKKNKRSVGFFLFMVYTISAVLAIVYYVIYASLNNDIDNLDIKSFAYLYICLMVGLWPFVNLKQVNQISISEKEYKLFIFFTYFVILVSIEPFVENVLLLFKPHDSYQLHIDVVEGELNIYSSLGSRLNNYCAYFRSFVPIATIIAYKLKEIPRIIKFGLLIPNINYLLIGYNTGTRGNIVCYVMMLICVYIFVISIFTKEEKRNIFKKAIAFGVVLLFMFVTISSSRFEGYSSSSNDLTMNVYLLQYAAEGQVLFNSDIWSDPPPTNGDVNFCFYKKLLGMKTYTTYREREDYYLAKNGKRIEVFRTYVGDFLTDLGYTGGFLFCLIITYFVFRLYNGGNMTIPLLFFYSNVLQMYGIGFASNVYRDYSMSKGFFIMMIFAFVLSYIRKNSDQFVLIGAENNIENEIIENENTSFDNDVSRS